MKLTIATKLVVSYLLVIGIAVVPAYAYLRSSVREEIADVLRGDLEVQLGGLVTLFSQTPDSKLAETVATLRGVIPQRVTLVAPNGVVIADTALTPELAVSHSDRPEVRAALEGRLGLARRTSTSTRQPTLYLARRFPLDGPVRGIVRIGISTKALEDVLEHGGQVLNNWAAVAGSVAVVLSLVASLLLTRPLRRLTTAARAFAKGDFGAPLDVATQDEVGDLAAALTDLAARLRTGLVGAGADRAFVQGLLDDLPLGVVLYDPQLEPRTVGAATRPLLGLESVREREQLRALVEQPANAAAARRAMDSGIALDTMLELPWRPGTRIRARFVPLFAADARREVALLVGWDADGHVARERTREALIESARFVRAIARQVSDDKLASDALLLASRLEQAVEPGEAEPASVTTVSLQELLRRLSEELRPLARHGEVRLGFDLPEQDSVLADAGSRGETAVRALLASGIERTPRGAELVVHASLEPGTVRLGIRTGQELSAVVRAAHLVRALGGDGGCRREGDGYESWLVLPRA